jgi:hypothetical protein
MRSGRIVHAPVTVAAGPHEVRDAEEVSDEDGRRLLVDVSRRAELLDAPLGHDGEAVGHRQRLLLVVRDVEEGDADLALDCLQLELERPAELRVERTQRLVEEKDARVEHERPRKRHPLLLPARELVRLALLEALEANEREHIRHFSSLLRSVEACEAEPEADVLTDREVREERVALEDRVDRPLVRRHFGDVLLAQKHQSLVRPLEARDDPKRRCLAAARRAEEREELPGPDVDPDIADRLDVAEALRDPFEGDAGCPLVNQGRRV